MRRCQSRNVRAPYPALVYVCHRIRCSMTFLPHKHLTLDATARSVPSRAVTFQYKPSRQVSGSIDAHAALKEDDGVPLDTLDLEVGQVLGTKLRSRGCRPRLTGWLHPLGAWNCLSCGNLVGNRRGLERVRGTVGNSGLCSNKSQHFVQGRNGGRNCQAPRRAHRPPTAGAFDDHTLTLTGTAYLLGREPLGTQRISHFARWLGTIRQQRAQKLAEWWHDGESLHFSPSLLVPKKLRTGWAGINPHVMLRPPL